MHWQEAVAKSPKGIATRIDKHIFGEPRFFYRDINGDSWYVYAGIKHIPFNNQIDGFDDWEPLA